MGEATRAGARLTKDASRLTSRRLTSSSPLPHPKSSTAHAERLRRQAGAACAPNREANHGRPSRASPHGYDTSAAAMKHLSLTYRRLPHCPHRQQVCAKTRPSRRPFPATPPPRASLVTCSSSGRTHCAEGGSGGAYAGGSNHSLRARNTCAQGVGRRTPCSRDGARGVGARGRKGRTARSVDVGSPS